MSINTLINILNIINYHVFSETDKHNIANFLVHTFPKDHGVFYFLCDDAKFCHYDLIQGIMSGIFTDMIKHLEGYEIIWSEYEIALIAYIFNTGGCLYEIPLNIENEEEVCKSMWKLISSSFAIPDNYYNTELYV